MFGDAEAYEKTTATVITDASLTTAVYIAPYSRVAIEVPTFSLGVATINASVALQVAQQSSDTFRTLRTLTINSAGSGILQWEVPLSKGGYTVVCRDLAYYNWCKVEITGTNATGTAGLECVVHKSR